jgi:Ca-activated chloride channel homolog
VLLMRPPDGDAKWNYELALREKKGGGGGGGGGADEQAPNAAPDPGAQPEAPVERPSGGLGQQQAEAILNSAARDERDVQEKRREKATPPRPTGGKDW